MTPMRRGACPTLDTPLATGDGLLVRLRLPGGRLTPAQLAELARLAGRFGNGLVEITRRGALQVRGLTPATAPLFAEAARACLARQTRMETRIETGLAVDISPLSGEDPHEKADPRPLLAAIRAQTQPLWPRLAPKVSVVIDGGGQIPLAGLGADMRLIALGPDLWRFTAGGSPPQSLTRAAAIALVCETCHLLAGRGPAARASDLYPYRDRADRAPLSPPPCPIGRLRRRAGTSFGFALPFASADTPLLERLARAAASAGIGQLRLAPGHAFLADDPTPAFIAQAEALGLIADPNDARLRVSACPGSQGCQSGHIAARQLARSHAGLVPPGQHWHISGCAKGCAHAGLADLTLIGTAHGIGLVRNGRAGDTPERMVQAPTLAAALRDAYPQDGR